MDLLKVWAPRARRVEVEVAGARRPLAAEGDGWWTLGAALPPGSDYAFVLDGGSPLPDPRSAWQPRGVHGPSRAFDPTAFRWTDGGWTPPALEDGAVYELHVGTFTREGTFDAAIERLDHLAALGVTHVELLPIAEASGARGWGYDGVGLYAAHHAYGGPAALQRFVDACHARGLAVLLDVVYNHLGPEGNYLPRFGPYFSETSATPWGPAMNLDGPGSPAVRRFLCDNARWWLEAFHLDGLRVDAVHALHDRSPEHLLAQLARETAERSRALGRRLVLIAETNRHDPRTITPAGDGGHGFDAQWCDDLHHALHAALTGERAGWYEDFGRLAHVAQALARGFVLEPGAPGPKKRRRKPAPAPAPARAWPTPSAHRFLGYLQNHDQVGNRACGERLHHLVGDARARAAATLVLCGPGVPMLFQGEEWGATTPWLFFCDHRDPWLPPSVREGRWREFGAPWGLAPDDMPDPQAAATFEASKLDWRELERPERRAWLEHHRALLALRRARADLRDAAWPVVRHDEAAGWLVLGRARTAVAVNLGRDPHEVPLPALPGTPRVLLASGPGVTLGEGAVHLPPDTAAVVGV